MRFPTRRFLAIGAGALLLTGLAASQKNNTPEAQLRAAMDKETVDGDLKAAIEQYKKIIAQKGASKEVVAKALVRLGGAYEKQGSGEARPYYERVVREFADQTDAVQLAGTRLTAAGTLNASGKTFRQVWAGPGVSAGGVSPDGRYIRFNRGGDLMIRELTTGEERLVTRGAGCGNWSPDGKRLAVCMNGSEIGVVNSDGTGLRTVYRHSNGNEAWPEGWSSDGKRILAQEELKPDYSYKFFWVGAADGAVQPIPARKSYGFMFPSPDGRYLAYAGLPGGDSRGQNVYIMAIDGTGETNVSSPAVDEDPVGWTPDGKYLLTTRARRTSLWAIPVAGGKSQGPPVLIQRDFGSPNVQYLGVTPAGTFCYSILTSTSDIYTASMDPATGKVTSAPVPVPVSRSGNNVLPRWAPDSRRLLYYWGQPIVSTTGSIREMSVYSFDTGKEQRVASQIPLATGGSCWSRDGASILFNRTDAENPARSEAVRFNLNTGETTRLFAGAAPFIMRGCSDGLAGGFDQFGIKVRSLQDGSEKEIYKFGRNPGIVLPLLSHDGRSVAFVEGSGGKSSFLRVVPSDGGPARELASASFPAELQPVWGAVWSSDDRFVYFARRADGKAPYELLRVPAAGGTVESTGLKVGELRDLDIAPDGTRIAFSIGAVNQPEIWAMDNFLPRAK